MVATGNVGLAFGLVIGSGAATTLGACIVSALRWPALGSWQAAWGLRQASCCEFMVAWPLQIAPQLQPSGRRGRCCRPRRLGWSLPTPPPPAGALNPPPACLPALLPCLPACLPDAATCPLRRS